MAKLSATSKSIATINRRADLILNLYGENSEEYNMYKAQMQRYEVTINQKTGAVHIRDNRANRKEFRRLNAWSKRVKRTPAAVEKRRAAKKNAAYQQAADDYYEETGETLDRATFNNWLSTFDDFFAACYELATMQGLSGNDALEVAGDLYDNPSYFEDIYNQFENAGAFEEFAGDKTTYDEQAFENQYGINPVTGERIDDNAAGFTYYGTDPETGEPITNPDFYDFDF